MELALVLQIDPLDLGIHALGVVSDLSKTRMRLFEALSHTSLERIHDELLVDSAGRNM